MAGLSCDPSETGSLRTSPVYDSSVYFSVEGEAASIEDQSWFPFLSGNELHDCMVYKAILYPAVIKTCQTVNLT